MRRILLPVTLAVALASCGGDDGSGGGGVVAPPPAPAPTPTPTPPPALMPAFFSPVRLPPGPDIKYDAEGVPQVRIWCDQQIHYSPTTIAHWGLGAYARGEMDIARKAADWLLANQAPNGGFALMFDCWYPAGGGMWMRGPWYSAMTQGNVLSLLTRIWKVTGDTKYRDAAIRGLRIMTLTVEQGGVKSTLNGGVWFEETAVPGIENHILNGSIFGLMGIHDVWLYTGDTEAKTLWEAGEASQRANLNAHVIWAPFKDPTLKLPDPWMQYELPVNGLPEMPNYLTDHYMKVHIQQYLEMALRTNRPEYSQMATIMQGQLVKYLEMNP